MDVEEYKIVRLVVATILSVVFLILGSCQAENWHTRKMAEKDFCYLPVEQTNSMPMTTWTKCK